MRDRIPVGALTIALALTGCGRLPDAELAERVAREHAGAAVSKGMFAFSDAELAELTRVGLVEFTAGDDSVPFKIVPRKVVLSAEAETLGLKVEIPNPDWPWGPTGVRAEHLCEAGFGAVTGVVALDGGPLPAATVSYSRVNTKHSPLYQRLGTAKLDAARGCDPQAAETGTLILVKRDAGWVPNRPPVVKAVAGLKTNYEYNEHGQRVGAASRVTLDGLEISDLDDDPVEVIGWSGFNYLPDDTYSRIDEVADDKLAVDGTSAILTHVIIDGRASGAALLYRVRDPWERGGFRACIEGPGFSC